MKTPLVPFSSAGQPRDDRRGFALILVLSSLVLLSVLVLAFFASVTTERAASKSYSVSQESRKLADEALNIVTAQIKDATDQAAANNEAWISQPGLIRCFDTTGKMTTSYKLFPSDKMRDTSATYDPLDTTSATVDIPPATWYQSPGIYTDLNAPVYLAGLHRERDDQFLSIPAVYPSSIPVPLTTPRRTSTACTASASPGHRSIPPPPVTRCPCRPSGSTC